MIAPGGTIGILGSGQLGRMLSVAASRLGYRCAVYAPAPGPACDVAASYARGAYADAAALSQFVAGVDVVTCEFENVDADALDALDTAVPLRPSPAALRIAADRVAEKSFVEGLGGRAAPWRPVDEASDLQDALAKIGMPAILKSRRFGYDGKGQARIASAADVPGAWDAVGTRPAILEGVVAFEHEFSVVLARGVDGTVATYDAPCNAHRDGVLARSVLPAPDAVRSQLPVAAALARAVAERLDYVGVLTLEFFAGADGPVFNEMAPRVHNSGHWTIEGAACSQFENHIRAICGLPLGDTRRLADHVDMENLLGDDVDRSPELLREVGAQLHLYGKREARPGRKMGHVTRLG